jgi:hypothetical protein
LILKDTKSSTFFANVSFLRKLLKDVLQPNEVVNLKRGRDTVQCKNQCRRETKGVPEWQPVDTKTGFRMEVQKKRKEKKRKEIKE